jgi:cytidylate kinase
MKETRISGVIAIDGPAASGKSTVAQKTAKKLGAIYINTGNMYRAMTLAAIEKKLDISDPSAEKLKAFLSNTSLEYRLNPPAEPELLLNGKPAGNSIRSPKVAQLVSKIAAISEIRQWLVEKQREMVKNRKLVVMEGRDIGTVVFPGAKYKFFLTATPEVRARRRLEQSGEIPEGSTVATVAKEIAKRDKMDMNRTVAPLTKAEDATSIDSSRMSADEVVDLILRRVAPSAP